MYQELPDDKGFFGEFGGSFIPPQLKDVMKEITDQYLILKDDPDFRKQLYMLNKHYTGRPSPIYHAESLSEFCGGAQIYFKREDLNHTGAHKINHCLGEALLAKFMGKKKLIAETGAGQHGVALATAAALTGLKCDIYMGEIDIKKQQPNVVRMKILGANVHSVTAGTQTLKDAVDAAFKAYLQDPIEQFYAIGSVVGPHPFPMIVRDFQQIVGQEAKEQFNELTGAKPDCLIACVGGGSNAIGLFTAFLPDEEVKIIGVEPAGLGLDTPSHAATLTLGASGIIHGFKCHLLQDELGEPLPVYSIASGLDYPGVGPQHSYLKNIGRIDYETICDVEAVDAFFTLSRLEGIIPALESAHAVAFAMKHATALSKDKMLLVNLSGRGDKDIDFIARNFGNKYGLT
jgi:tryptophan synthase beta subunit